MKKLSKVKNSSVLCLGESRLAHEGRSACSWMMQSFMPLLSIVCYPGMFEQLQVKIWHLEKHVLSLGSGANSSEMRTFTTYWLIALLHSHSYAFTVLPGNDASLQLGRRLACKATLVLLAPTQLVQMAVYSLFDIWCTCSLSAKNKAFQLKNISSASP